MNPLIFVVIGFVSGLSVMIIVNLYKYVWEILNE